MPFVLCGNNYGKSRVRVLKVTHHPDRHDLAEIAVNVQFEGDFDAVHTAGDNRAVLPTDTMKNTVNALAKAWSGEQIEDFACQLIGHFLGDNRQVARRSEEHTSELQSLAYLVCRLLLEKKKTT